MKKILIAFVPALLLAVGTFSFIRLDKNPAEKKHDEGFIQIAGVDKDSSAAKLKDACCEEESAGICSENSIYQLNCTWKDQNGSKIMLNKFKGSHVILAMIYTSCATACPVIVNNMQKLSNSIRKDKLGDYHFVLVSIDPEIDTPAKLKKYAAEKKLDLNYWTLLTGSDNNVAELAQVIGFRYKRNNSGSAGRFTHSNLITFLNKDGEIVNQSKGLNQGTGALLAMLENKN